MFSFFFSPLQIQLPEVGRRPDVGRLPVLSERRPAENPHRHDDHHVQEDLRRPRPAVEVSFTPQTREL